MLRKNSISSISETKLSKSWKGSFLLKYRVIRIFQNHDRDNNSAPQVLRENRLRERASESSKDKWGPRRRILQRGRFPSGFPRNTRETFDVRVAARHGREYTSSPLAGSPTWVPYARLSSAFIQTICSRREDLMQSFPEKPQRSEQQHAGTMRTAGRDEEAGWGGRKQRHTWEGTVHYFVLFWTVSRDSILARWNLQRINRLRVNPCNPS